MSTHENAKLAIEYRPELRDALERVKKLPERFVSSFYVLVNDNPQIDVVQLIKTISQEYKAWKHPYSDPALDQAHRILQAYGDKATSELKRAHQVLGEKLDIDAATKQIIEKYSNNHADPDSRASVDDRLNQQSSRADHRVNGELPDHLADEFEEALAAISDSIHSASDPTGTHETRRHRNSTRVSEQHGLIHGSYGLATTFWLFNIGIPSVLTLLLSLSIATRKDALAGALFLLLIVYSIWALIGLWHASNLYSGAEYWAVAAKIYVGLTAITTVYFITELSVTVALLSRFFPSFI